MMEKIPRIIHYCWFGGGEKPELMKQCIRSWEEHLPHYELKQWDESNVDVTCNAYVHEAYQAKKYAFVSDYFRMYALYTEGGVYLDTDVEVYQSFDRFLHYPSFWGFEEGNYIATSTIGASKGHPLIQYFLESYQSNHFINDDGTFNEWTNVAAITEEMKKKGVICNGQKQVIEEMGVIFEQTIFSPYDYINCRDLQSDETVTKHHFYQSWLPPHVLVKRIVKRNIVKLIGGEKLANLRKKFSGVRS
ncbi:glycosyltransferase [Cytobacillus sp. FSL M8-0252]|uniref:glycosyltransferase family 32 protein n=2 Tax=Cytobacillus TaxID=2675230 RepID=UPI0030FBACFD